MGSSGALLPEHQPLVTGILEECFEIAQDVEAREKDVSFTLKPIYDRLMEIRGQLEGLVMTHRWTLRETDLWNYENALRDIDRMRVDGKFVDSEGNKPQGQYVSHLMCLWNVRASTDGGVLGAPVPSAEMLWLDLPAVVLERTGI